MCPGKDKSLQSPAKVFKMLRTLHHMQQ